VTVQVIAWKGKEFGQYGQVHSYATFSGHFVLSRPGIDESKDTVGDNLVFAMISR